MNPKFVSLFCSQGRADLECQPQRSSPAPLCDAERTGSGCCADVDLLNSGPAGADPQHVLQRHPHGRGVLRCAQHKNRRESTRPGHKPWTASARGDITDASVLNRTLKGLANQVDVLWGVPDSSLYTTATARTVLVSSLRHHIPFFGLSDPWVQVGAALGTSRDHTVLGDQCARITGELLDGTPELVLASRTPSSMPYSINLQSLEDMNVLVPPQIEQEARHVY